MLFVDVDDEIQNLAADFIDIFTIILLGIDVMKVTKYLGAGLRLLAQLCAACLVVRSVAELIIY